MMTPQEVSQHSFAKASFGGYNMSMVDEFLDQLTSDYSTLYKENAVLKSKMKVLVDKIEEYRSTDEAMRMALLAAQKMADQLVEDAKKKKEEILSEAETTVAQGRLALQHELASEQMRLTTAQQSTEQFVSKLKEMYHRELAFLETLAKLEAPKPKRSKPDPVTTAAEDIENSLQKMAGSQSREEPVAAEEREEPQECAEENNTIEQSDKKAKKAADPAMKKDDMQENTGEIPTPIDFENLQFGREYEVK